jgi:hypothetical protein
MMTRGGKPNKLEENPATVPLRPPRVSHRELPGNEPEALGEKPAPNSPSYGRKERSEGQEQSSVPHYIQILIACIVYNSTARDNGICEKQRRVAVFCESEMKY